MTKLEQPSNSNWTILFLCWLLVSVSTIGSVFFSHVMEFAPCVLCWYQRICLFPLVIILAVGLFPLARGFLVGSLSPFDHTGINRYFAFLLRENEGGQSRRLKMCLSALDHARHLPLAGTRFET